jgi:hypothetical protein
MVCLRPYVTCHVSQPPNKTKHPYADRPIIQIDIIALLRACTAHHHIKLLQTSGFLRISHSCKQCMCASVQLTHRAMLSKGFSTLEAAMAFPPCLARCCCQARPAR